MLRWEGGGRTQLKKQKPTIWLSHRYLTKANRLHSWSIWIIPKHLKRRNCETRGPLCSNDDHNTQREQEQWKVRGRREGINGLWPPRPGWWACLAGDTLHLVNSSSRSRGACAVSMTAQQYLPQCVHKAHQQGLVYTHQQLHWQTTPQQPVLSKYWHGSNNWESHRKRPHSFGFITGQATRHLNV